MTRAAGLLAVVVLASTVSLTAVAPRPAADPTVLARGRYLVVFGGCNDCHTPGWRESDGTLPTSRWLTGNRIGYRGAWGTSYAVNLRIEFQSLPEDQWTLAVHTRGGLPPMIWHDVRGLNVADQHAIYAFIRSLGPAGSPAPAAIPPWREPTTPYIDTRPRNLARRRDGR
jgi:hypothetical protein